MAYKSESPMFRNMTDEEEESFRQWVRCNYVKGQEVKNVWHPVVRDECRKVNEEGITNDKTREGIS